MTMTNKSKIIGGIATLAAASLALVGCSAGAEPEAQPEQPEAAQAAVTQADPEPGMSESYIRVEPATNDGGHRGSQLYTLSIDDTSVKITRSVCNDNRATSSVLDTAYGESEDGAVTWHEGGGYTDQGEVPFEILADGDRLLVGDDLFHHTPSGAHGVDTYMQGWDLQEWWTMTCRAGAPSPDAGGEA